MKKTYESPNMDIVLFAPLDNTNGGDVSGTVRSVDSGKNWH